MEGKRMSKRRLDGGRGGGCVIKMILYRREEKGREAGGCVLAKGVG